MATVSLSVPPRPLKSRDHHGGPSFSSSSSTSSTSPSHRRSSSPHLYHHYHHYPNPATTNTPTSPYHRPTSPHRRPVSPHRRPSSPHRRSVSPHSRPVSPKYRNNFNFHLSPPNSTSGKLGSKFPSSPELATPSKSTPKYPVVSNTNLQCAVCLKDYSDARLLPCFHTFCAKCLELSCLQKGTKVDSVYCPICMESSELTSKGVQGLPKNTYVKHLQQLQRSPSPELNCDLCVGNEVAVGRCEKCDCNLCEFCVHAHQKQRKTSHHQLVNLDQNDSSSIDGAVGSMLCRASSSTRGRSRILFCKVHIKEKLDLYCKTCGISVCAKCILTAHTGHTFLPMDEVNMQYTEILQGLLARAKPFASSVEESMKKIDFVLSSIQERSQLISEEIIEFVSFHVRALQEHKQSLLQQLHAIKHQKEDTLKTQVANLTEILDQLNLNCTMASKALQDGTPFVAFNSGSPVASKLEEILSSKQEASPKEDDYIQFRRGIKSHEINGFRMFGVLDPRGPSAANSVASGEGLYEAQEAKLAQFKVEVNDRYKQRREKGGDKVEAILKNVRNNTVCVSMKDGRDGSYVVSYTPESKGEHQLSVLVESNHIRGSPFMVNVRPKPKQHGGVFHCCTFCSSKGKKHIRCGCGGTMPGGYSGCGHGHPGHPGHWHWSCCGNIVKKSDCVH